MVALAFAVVLFGLTIAIFMIDRAVRSKRGALSPFHEPDVGTLFLLCFLFNIACLPYYFHKTREGAIGIVAGIGSFIGTFVVAFVVAMVVAMAKSLLG
jgi:hypothetical protein